MTAALNLAFHKAFTDHAKVKGVIYPDIFDETIDTLVDIVGNQDYICNTCGCIGLLTANESLTGALLGWIAHIECPSTTIHKHFSEGHGLNKSIAISRAVIHWRKYS